MVAARSRSLRTVATAFAAVCLVTLTITAAGAVTADSQVTIDEESVEQTDGDVAEFTLSVPAGENVTVVVEGNESYRRQLHLADATGDGEITLSLNSYLAGRDAETSRVYSVAGDDTLSVAESETDGALSAGSYRVAAYDNRTGDAPADTATLSLAEPGLANATVMVAPDGVADRLTSRSAIRQARQDGTVRRSTNVVTGDTFIFRMTAPGIAGAVAAENGSDADAQFRAFLDRPGVVLNLTQKRVGPGREAVVLPLDSTTVSSVVADPQNDTYYVIVDLPTEGSDRDWETPTERFVDYLHDDRVVPRLVVDGQHRLNPGNIRTENRTGQFEIYDADADLPALEESTVQPKFWPEQNQTVRIATNVAPGSIVTISVVDAYGIDGPRNVTRRVPPRSNVTDDEGLKLSVFTVAFDLSEIEPGEEFELRVTSDGSTIDRRLGLRTHTDHRAPSIDLSDEPLANATVHVENATLPHGGFVVVKSADRERTLANSDYLEPGSHEDLRLNVSQSALDRAGGELYVTLYGDSDNDRLYLITDEQYRYNGTAFGTTIHVQEENPAETPTATTTTTEPTETPTATAPDPTTETRTTAPTATPSATPDQSTATPVTPSETSATGPGLSGLSAIVAVALGGSLAVARRWRGDR